MASIFKRGGRANRKGYYYFAYLDHAGRRRVKCAKTTDKAAAERIAAKREAEAALRRARVIDPRQEALAGQARRPIAQHLADFEAGMRAAGRAEKHILCTATFIRAVCGFAGFERACDIDAEGVARYAAMLRDQGRAARTIQAHLTAVKAFTRWLTRGSKLPADPLVGIVRPSPKADRRLRRRMLLPDEWAWLRSVTLADDAARLGMSARERVLLYATALQTGLRASELASLTRANLFLEEQRPFITCDAADTKNRAAAKQYIQAGLAAELAAVARAKLPRAPLFGAPRRIRAMAGVLRADLAAARKAWLRAAADAHDRLKREQSDFLSPTNHNGERLDFHALRHTCGAWLAIAGEHPKTIQTILRHSSITLTMDTYGHLLPGQDALAVARLPGLLDDAPQALRATGTLDAMPAPETSRSAQRQAQRAGRGSVRGRSTACDGDAESCGAGRQHNLLPASAPCEAVQAQTMTDTSGGEAAQTPAPRIANPRQRGLEVLDGNEVAGRFVTHVEHHARREAPLQRDFVDPPGWPAV